MPWFSGALKLAAPTTALLLLAVPAVSQSSAPSPQSRVLRAVDDSSVTPLQGNTHPLARPEFDQGALDDAAPMRRMVLVLQRGQEQESALQELIDQQQDKTSSTFHQWLTPESFGAAFGPTDRDLSAVTTWLSSHGFSGIRVNAAHTFVEFDGTAGLVRSAFRTSMHRYSVEGQQRFANASDPSIPAALSPVIAGIASLNNFPRKAQSHRSGSFRYDVSTRRTNRLSAQAEQAQPDFTINQSGETSYGVTPYDFATIYNVLPLWNASTPIDGTGQTIAIVGQTDINPADFVNFRKLFNLPLGNTATPTGTQYLNIIYNGPNPGVNGDEGEADIDTQWSGAVARGATIDYVVSQSTEVTQGTDLSAIYIVDNNLAPVMSYSYGQCELFLGTSGNAFYKSLWQQAAAQGITVLVASGDSGSGGCDGSGYQGASNGLAVNGLGSTPYNISVGGTDFYMPNGGTAFWNAANNITTEASAKGYIPETPWNQSCTNSVFGISGTFSGQTPEQVCNSSTAASFGLLSVVGAGGGPSTCIQSNGSSSSSCRGGYAKPSWQTGAGVPSDNVRDVPDVSLFASAGFFGAFYVVCQQSTDTDGQPCSLNAPAYDFAGYGGTSVATPALAGILSLVNQKTGSRQGNANYVLYNLASQQSKAGTVCNSISGTPAAGCVFNDITTDTIAMPCLKGSANCTVTNSGDRYGVLSGYASTAGYDLASGLGSVNAANLVNNWSNANFVASATSLSISPATITHGSQVSATVKVSAASGTPTGNVSINALAANGSVQNGTLQNGNFTASLGNFPGGTYSVQAHYAGDGVYAPSDSNPVTLTVSPESSVTTLGGLLYNPSTGVTTTLSNGGSLAYGGYVLVRAVVAGASGQGNATGNVTLTDSGAPLDGGIFRLNSTSNTEDQTRALSPGTHVITAAYAGDPSFNPSSSSSFTINITRAQTASALQVSEPVLSAAGILTLTAQVVARGFGSGGQQGFGASAPSGIVTFNSGGVVVGTATLNQQTYPTYSTDSSAIAFTLPASQLPIGDNAITVSYAGDANYAPSMSAATTVTVTGATQTVSTTMLSLSAAAVAAGASFTFTASVSPHSPLPTGTITFLSDGKPAGPSSIVVAGVASASNVNLAIAPGTHLITAVYSGDTNYQSSVSAPVSFTLGTSALPSTTTVTITPSTVVQGTAITVSAAISPAVPVPTGTAQLILDGNLYGSPVAVTGAAINLSLLTDTLQAGSHVVRIFYSGDSNHQASNSAQLTVTILNSSGSFVLTPSMTTTSAVLGKSSNPVTITATPSGGFHSTITFSCTGGLPSGTVCQFTPSSIVPNGATPQTTALTISPSGVPLQIAQSVSFPGTSRTHGLSPQIAVAFAGLLCFFVPRRARRLSVFIMLLALSTLSLLGGCGSGASDPSIPSPSSLSAGTYTITVTAAGGSTIQTATVNLTIQ
jgi:Pro-kumamolisin, activation domain/Bacterial Ig-like domain (group 3)